MSMPRYAQDAISNQGQSPGFLSMAPGFASIASGFFNDASAPYKAAEAPYSDFMQRASDVQNPFYNAGKAAIPDFQTWLKGMSDPSGFINTLMGKYQQSPWAKYQQQEAIRAAQNVGSASGLTGSTPLMQQAQQNAANISSGDMNQWLQNVLGINTQYGAGQQSLINTGQTSANALSDLFAKRAEGMGNLEYGRRAGQNENRGNIIGGIASFF